MPTNVSDYDNLATTIEAPNYWDLWERLPRPVRDAMNYAPLSFGVTDAFSILQNSDPWYPPDFDFIMQEETRRISHTGIEGGRYRLERKRNVTRTGSEKIYERRIRARADLFWRGVGKRAGHT